MSQRQTFNVKGLDITIAEEKGCISDIRIPVNAAQRHRFLNIFTQKDITPETNCYTGLLRDGLVEYNYHQKLHGTRTGDAVTQSVAAITGKLGKCIAPFIELERLVNNSVGASADGFAALTKLEQSVEKNFTDTITALELKESDALYVSLEKNKKTLLGSIQSLREKVPDSADLQQLFCIQDGAIDGTGEIHSLGTYLANQLILICDHSINDIYHATSNRLQQAFFMHPAIKALSDVKSQLEIRGLSLKGAREENSLTPIPKDLLNALQLDPTEINSKDSGEIKELSLAPYLHQFSDAEEVNRMIEILSEEKTEKFTEHPIEWSLVPLIFLTNVLEYIPAGLHLCASIISFLGEGPCWLLNLMSSSDAFHMKWLDEKATYYHHKFSPVKWCKAQLKEEYLSYYQNMHRELINHLWYTSTPSENLDSHKMTIHQQNEYSMLNLLCSVYSGHRMAEKVGHFWRGALEAIKNIGVKFSFVFFIRSTPEDRKAAFQNKQKEVRENWKTLQDEFKTSLKDVKCQEKKTKEPTETNGEENKPSAQPWPVGKPWPQNKSPSIVDVTSEICSVADKLIGPIFRHRPGSATIFFGFSCASLSVLLHPALSTNPQTAWIGYASTWLLKNFTGKAVTDGAVAKVMAAFLQWKMLILASEVSIELAEGNITFLRQLFKDLDKTTFIILVLVSGGAALQLLYDNHIELPTGLPASLANPTNSVWINDYLNFSTQALAILPALINALSEESSSCSAGQFPFLEYLVLGIKLGLVLQCAFGGKKEIPLFNSVKIIEEMMADPIWKTSNQKTDAELEKIIKDKLAAQGIENRSGSVEYQECIAVFVKAIKERISPEQSKEVHEIKKIAPPVLSPAQQKLKEAIQLVQEMQTQGQSGFQNKKQSWLFYDYLNDCFDEYNAEMSLYGLKEIDKEDYLNAFRNQYCDKGEVMLFRLFSIIPFYPVTLLWRGLNYLITDSQYIKDNIAHSFSKDAAMFLQFFSDIIRPVREIFRTTSYVLRTALAIPMLVLSSPVLGYYAVTEGLKKSREMIEDMLTWTAQIRLHHFTATRFLKAKYAKIARATNINEESSDLVFFGDQILSHINESQKKCIEETKRAWQVSCEKLADERAQEAKQFFGCSTYTINKSVRQLEAIASSALPEDKKEEKRKKVMLQLGNEHDIKTFKRRVMGAPAAALTADSHVIPAKAGIQ